MQHDGKAHRWETVEEMSQRTGVPRRTLYDWCKRGLRHSRPGRGGKILLREEDVNRYIEAHATGGGSHASAKGESAASP